MKCPNCGAHSDMETPFCPYCGKEIPFFKKHREDMAEYEQRIRQTQTTVVSENRRFSSKAARITIFCILIIFVLLSFIALSAQSQIRRSILASRNHSNADKHLAVLREYEEAGDFVGLAEYYDFHSLDHGTEDESFGEFGLVERFASSYRYVVQYVEKYQTEQDEKRRTDLLQYVIEDYVRFFNYYHEYIEEPEEYRYYQDSAYSDVHFASIEKMKDLLHSLFISQFHIGADEIEEFDRMDEIHKTVFIEERLTEGD